MRRLVAALSLSLLLASCFGPPAPAPEDPAPDEDAVNPLPPRQAARIDYDPASRKFTLVNVSKGFIFYDWRECCECQFADGWEQVNHPGDLIYDCGNASMRKRIPLAPGEKYSIGRFHIRHGSLKESATAFIQQGGDLTLLPARVAIEVSSSKSKGPVNWVYSPILTNP